MGADRNIGWAKAVLWAKRQKMNLIMVLTDMVLYRKVPYLRKARVFHRALPCSVTCFHHVVLPRNDFFR